MVSYLNAPRTATFSHESRAKQQDALAELDASVDEWMTKLESADQRRQRIRLLLMEHTVALLMLPVPVPGPSPSPATVTAMAEPTPPQSPEKMTDRSFSTERRDVESIRVYADSGVTSLLASIKMELDRMERCHDETIDQIIKTY